MSNKRDKIHFKQGRKHLKKTKTPEEMQEERNNVNPFAKRDERDGVDLDDRDSERNSFLDPEDVDNDEFSDEEDDIMDDDDSFKYDW